MPAAALSMRASMLIFFFAGMGIFLLLAGIGGWITWLRYSNTQNWNPIEAEISWSGKLCDIERKNRKIWDLEATVNCDEADAYITEKSSLLSASRRKREIDYIQINYEAGGQMRQKLLHLSAVSRIPLNVGDKAPVFVDPNNPETTDRAFDAGDMRVFWTIASVGAVAWIGVIFLGWAVVKLNARLAARKQA